MHWKTDPIELRTAQADRIAERIESGSPRIVVGGATGAGKTELLRSVARRLDKPAIVTLGSERDSVAHAILSVASQLSTGVRQDVHHALRSDGGRPDRALACLTEGLGDRVLLVDDRDRLGIVGGTDRMLAWSFRSHRGALRHWLRDRARLVTTTIDTRESRQSGRVEYLDSLDDELPPYRLLNGVTHGLEDLWEVTRRNPRTFRDVLSQALVREEAGDLKRGKVRSPRAVIQSTWNLLPASLRRAIATVCAHGRSLPLEAFRGAFGDGAKRALAEAERTLLIERVGGDLWVQPTWVEWFQAYVPKERQRRTRLRLARAFSELFLPDDSQPGDRALFVLEAHRHYLAAGEADKAREMVVYSVGPLLGHARGLSLAGRHADSSHVYDAVLGLDRKLCPEAATKPTSPEGIGIRPRAYAVHYRHYNRAKAPEPLEPISDTVRGYQRAIGGWPQNALFWSRYALSLFHSHDLGAGLQAVADAQRNVPLHRMKQHTLVERTVERLLRRKLFMEALLVWERHQPREAATSVVEDELLDALAAGWETPRLFVSHAATVVFCRPIRVSIDKLRSGFACSIDAIGVSGRADTPLRALEQAIRDTRSLATSLREALTHTLSAEERLRKRQVLSNVDLMASRLLGETPSETWVLGRLELLDEQIVFRSGDVDGDVYAIDDAVQPSLDDTLRFARVTAGLHGEPLGPVVEIEAPLVGDPEATQRAWCERLARA